MAKPPKKIEVIKPHNGGFMRPREAAEHLSVSLFTVNQCIMSRQPIYAKRGNKFVLIEGYEMPLVDMSNLPKQTNEKQNYSVNHYHKKM